MPSRVIRGEINRSESLSRVSMEAELTFDRLLLAVDDYGRLDARPAALKAELFPMRDSVTPAKVRRWVEELASIEDPPVRFYRVGGREYLYFPNWEKHRSKSHRSSHSRFPEPAETQPPCVPEIREISGDSRRSARMTSDECRMTSDEKESAPPARERARRERREPKDFPEGLSVSELDALKTWSVSCGLGPDAVAHAIEVVRDWAVSNGKRKADWVSAIRNAMREGWALKGYVARGAPAQESLHDRREREYVEEQRRRFEAEKGLEMADVVKLADRIGR